MPLPPEFHELAKKVNNWGRWGPEDERGTLNLITDEVVRRAVASIRTGRRFFLAIPLGEDGPMMGNVPGRPGNPVRTMTTLHFEMSKNPDAAKFSDDMVSMPLQAATHWDSLAHYSYMGWMLRARGAFRGSRPATRSRRAISMRLRRWPGPGSSRATSCWCARATCSSS